MVVDREKPLKKCSPGLEIQNLILSLILSYFLYINLQNKTLMSEELSSEGKCLYCEQVFPQKEIIKHLAKHLAEKEKTESGTKTQPYCHMVVVADIMFLHLLVKETASFKLIDSFLRDIWLDCCGHMSAFMKGSEEISMSKKVKDVLINKEKLVYDYDYGSTTRLSLKGLKYYELNETKNIVLLSRNEPLKIMCSTCGKESAVSMCTTCCWEKEAFFCRKCAENHEKDCEDFADFSEMPVVNSPRMGVCGYEGGSIDTERDRVYQINKVVR